ncbi:MAG: hypothetical protein IJ828_09500 [Treponema sp.]|nr:hypothetical protein [Treponema sp.]
MNNKDADITMQSSLTLQCKALCPYNAELFVLTMQSSVSADRQSEKFRYPRTALFIFHLTISVCVVQ